MPCRAHVLRHSIATLASNSGADVQAVAAMLNHSSTATVSTYLHSQAGRVEEARARVRSVMSAGNAKGAAAGA